MRILVTGDRNWTDRKIIRTILSSYGQGDTLIHGCCRGADVIAAAEAEDLGMSVERFPADWKGFGRAAGPIRNRRMLIAGKPDLVYAFHDDMTKSRGTKNMVYQAIKARIRTAIVSHETTIKWLN